MRKINMSGLRFGRLTVLCEDGRLMEKFHGNANAIAEILKSLEEVI